MRISDWSSDVCSSDLAHPLFGGTQDECQRAGHDEIEDGDRAPDLDRAKVGGHDLLALAGQLADADDDEQRGVFQTDDALVAERRDHAAEGGGADDVEPPLPRQDASRDGKEWVRTSGSRW